MADYVYTLQMQVRDYELDSEGIVNNANYLHYLEHTRHRFCAENGISFSEMQQTSSPCSFSSRRTAL